MHEKWKIFSIFLLGPSLFYIISSDRKWHQNQGSIAHKECYKLFHLTCAFDKFFTNSYIKKFTIFTFSVYLLGFIGFLLQENYSCLKEYLVFLEKSAITFGILNFFFFIQFWESWFTNSINHDNDTSTSRVLCVSHQEKGNRKPFSN